MTETSCPECHRVYDMLAYQPGQKLRCVCGKILIALAMGAAKRAKVINCSRCGGHLEKGRDHCPFCEALVDPVDVRYVVYCGECLSMNKEGSNFCAECGQPIQGKADAPKAVDAPCPRCTVKMRQRNIEGLAVEECPICCGIFVESDQMESLLEPHIADADAALPSKPQKATLKIDEVKYLKCPSCAQLMNRLNYGRVSGVMIDSCSRHGMWLDAGELEKIAKWVATGGFEEMRRYQADLEKVRRQSQQRAQEALNRAQIQVEAPKYSSRSWRGWSAIASIARILF